MFSLIFQIKTCIQEEKTTTPERNRHTHTEPKLPCKTGHAKVSGYRMPSNSITFRLTVDSVSMDNCFLPNFVFIIVSHPIWSLLDCKAIGFLLLFLTQPVDYFLSKYLSIYLLLYLGEVFFILFCQQNVLCYHLLLHIKCFFLWNQQYKSTMYLCTG